MKAVEVVVKDKDGSVVYRTGYNLDLYEEYLKRNTNDLPTLWTVRFFTALLTPVTRGHYSSFSFTDTGGTARIQDVKRNTGSDTTSDLHFFNTYVCSNRLWISYGSSSAPPSRTDYKLGSKLGEGVTTITVDETAGIITLSVSFTITTDITVYEVGLEWEGCVSSFNVCGKFLVDRTVFPEGIPVRAGQTLTVIYRFIF